MDSTNSKRPTPSGDSPQRADTEDIGMIVPFPVYKSTVPYKAGIKVSRPPKNYQEYCNILFQDEAEARYQRFKELNEKLDTYEGPKLDAAPPSPLQARDDLMIRKIFRDDIIPTAVHPDRIFLPKLASCPTVNKEPPGYIELNSGCVVLYKPPVSTSTTHSSPSSSGYRPQTNPEPSPSPSPPPTTPGFQPSTTLLTTINTKHQKTMSRTRIGSLALLHEQAQLLDCKRKDIRAESAEFDEEYERMKREIKESERRIRLLVEMGSRGKHVMDMISGGGKE